MGLFGGGEKRRERRAAENARNHAEHARVGAMPLPELAAEVMERGFGPGTVGDERGTTVGELLDGYMPVGVVLGLDHAPRSATKGLLNEALQALENRGLLVSETHGGGDYAIRVFYRKTRAGEQALGARDVAARLSGS